MTKSDVIEGLRAIRKDVYISQSIYIDAAISLLEKEPEKKYCQCTEKPVFLISYCRNCKKEIENPPTIEEMLEEPKLELPEEIDLKMVCYDDTLKLVIIINALIRYLKAKEGR